MPRFSATIWATATEEISSASVARFGASGGDGLGAGIDRRHEDARLRLVDRGLPTRDQERDRDRQQRDGQDRPLAEPQDGQDLLEVQTRLRARSLDGAYRPDAARPRTHPATDLWPSIPSALGVRTTLGGDRLRPERHTICLASPTEPVTPLRRRPRIAPSKRRRRYPLWRRGALLGSRRTLYRGALGVPGAERIGAEGCNLPVGSGSETQIARRCSCAAAGELPESPSSAWSGPEEGTRTRGSEPGCADQPWARPWSCSSSSSSICSSSSC